MAEARSIASIRNVRGGASYVDDEGQVHLRLHLVIPPISMMGRSAARVIRRAYRGIQYTLYPIASPPVFIALVAVFVGIVINSPPDSWLRSGSMAALVWEWGNKLPWIPGIPLAVKVGTMAAWIAMLGLIGLATIERRFLKLLLMDKAFLYQGRKPTLWLKVWGALVIALTRGKPKLYSFQSSLPRQSVPPVKDTVEKYLASMKPLQDDETFEKTKAEAEAFLNGPAWKIQAFLVAKSWWSPHYNTDWWEKYVYLKGRSPIAINSNYYVLDSGRWTPTPVQEARAAVLLHSFMKFKERLENDDVAPIMVPINGKGAIPLCMWQYERMFATSRIPGREIDEIKHWDASSIRHVAVACKGSYYKLNLYRKDGSLMTPREIEHALVAIKRDAGARTPREAEASLPAVTGDNRTRWAEIRETYFADGINRRSLNTIEKALIWVSLEDTATEMLDWTGRARQLIHGNRDRPNVWFDKSVNLIFFANGKMGVNAEHAWADAPVVAHLLEEAHIIAEGAGESMYDESGHVKPGAAEAGGLCGGRKGGTATASGASQEEDWARIPWALSAEAEEAILGSKATLVKAMDNFDLRVVSTADKSIGGPGYGKDFIKKCKVSPDAFIQMAMQLAYYRDQAEGLGKGQFAATYESSMTRFFLHGRTETIRPLSQYSVDFVRAMENPACTPMERLQALQRAAKKHVLTTHDSMAGKGIDRHLFSLYATSVGFGVDVPFLKNAISVPWKLSTSQQPQQQTPYWDIKDPKYANKVSPGGGFGPVAEDGYGVSYMVSGEREIFFHISALKHSAPKTDAGRFLKHLFRALTEMKTVLSIAVSEEEARLSPRPVAAAPAPALAAPAAGASAAPAAAEEDSGKSAAKRGTSKSRKRAGAGNGNGDPK